MLGSLRFVLALTVVMNHMWLVTSDRVGASAVVGFYMISGYLMSRVLTEVYNDGLKGFGRYILNRVLRIYPTYWLLLIVTLLSIFFMPGYFGIVYSIMAIPSGAYDWFRNFSLFQLTWSPVITIPPAWSLSVEMFFYLAMGIALSRRRTIALIWLVCSVAATVVFVWTGQPFAARYYPVQAASLFFSIGAVLYHYRDRLRWLCLPPLAASVGLIIFIPFPLLVEALGGDRFLIGYYGAAVLFVPILATTLYRMRASGFEPWDRYLGDLAYPVFLSHFLAGGVVNLLSGRALAPLSFGYFIASMAVSIGLSILVLRYVDLPVQAVRDLVRRRARPKLAARAAAGDGPVQTAGSAAARSHSA